MNSGPRTPPRFVPTLTTVVDISAPRPEPTSEASSARVEATSAANSAESSPTEAPSLTTPAPDAPDLMRLPTDPATRLERDALMAILQYPDHVGADLIRRAAQVAFVDNTLAVVRDAIATTVESDSAVSADWLSRVAEDVPPPFSTLVKQLGVAPIPEREELIATYCRGVTTSLIDRDLLRQKRDLLGAMQRIDAASDPERYGQVQRDLVRIESERRALRDE